MTSHNQVINAPVSFIKLIYRILDETANDSGFMVAFTGTTHPYRMGFCFFKSDKNYIGVIRGIAHSYIEPLRLAVDANVGLEEGVVFTQGHLCWVASQMGLPYEQLMGDINGKIWRFIGYVDRVGCRWTDNSIAWRALWGRLIEVATAERLSYREPKVVEFLIKALRHCAADGQTVLDR